jgi:hypothetical protein
MIVLSPINVCSCTRCRHEIKIPEGMSHCNTCLFDECRPLRRCPYQQPKPRPVHPAVEVMKTLNRMMLGLNTSPRPTHFSGLSAEYRKTI